MLPSGPHHHAFTRCLVQLLAFAERRGILVYVEFVRKPIVLVDACESLPNHGPRYTAHQWGLAADCAITAGGSPMQEAKLYHLLGEKWLALDERCIWGAGEQGALPLYHFAFRSP